VIDALGGTRGGADLRVVRPFRPLAVTAVTYGAAQYRRFAVRLQPSFVRLIQAPRGAASDMKRLIQISASVIATSVLCAATSAAFAQNSPGVPGGILTDQFRLQEHPQLQFAASESAARNKKYQKGRSQMRKRGDNGDPDGCNLQCPQDP
jgi:hypothetical protein